MVFSKYALKDGHIIHFGGEEEFLFIVSKLIRSGTHLGELWAWSDLSALENQSDVPLNFLSDFHHWKVDVHIYIYVHIFMCR